MSKSYSITLEERRLIWAKRRREQRIKLCKKIALLVMLMLFAGVCSFVISSKVKADSDIVLHKYYTTITVESNDTLWDIASDHSLGYKSNNKYIDEVMFINHLNDANDIRVGMRLTIPYYEESIK